MLKRRGNTVRVKLADPIFLPAPDATPMEPEQPPIDVGLAIKLATLIFIVTQGALLIYGYSVLVGNYDYYGIDINELDIGKPTLLLYGYIHALSTIFELSKGIPNAGGTALLMLCLIVSAIFVFALTNKAKAGTRASVLFSIFIPLVFIVITPAKGIKLGSDIGQADLKKFIGNEEGGEYKAEQIIITSNKQKLVGKLILADSRFTFLATQKTRKNCPPTLTIYKLSNSDNKIMRQTVLTPVLDASHPQQKSC